MNNESRVEELLEKMLVIELYQLKIPKKEIAKYIGRQKQWVVDLLKELPEMGE